MTLLEEIARLGDEQLIAWERMVAETADGDPCTVHGIAQRDGDNDPQLSRCSLDPWGEVGGKWPEVPVVYYQSRYVVAWVGGRWIRRQRREGMDEFFTRLRMAHCLAMIERICSRWRLHSKRTAR